MAPICGQRYLSAWHVYLYDTNNMAGATAGAELMTRTVVVEIKYFCTKNVVIHTENCKLNLLLDCSTTQMEKNSLPTTNG